LECGTCRIACPHSALEWEYPRSGFGVQFRFG
jgi:ferredoxin like protein